MSASNSNLLTLHLTVDQLRAAEEVNRALQSAGTLQSQHAFLSPDHVSEILGISSKQVRRMVAAGQLPGHRVGKLLRIAR